LPHLKARLIIDKKEQKVNPSATAHLNHFDATPVCVILYRRQNLFPETNMAKKKRRKLSKAEAKQEALRQKKRQQMTWVLGGVIAVAAIVVFVLVAMSSDSQESLPTPDSEPIQVDTQGYPQLGSDDAPVTVIEFSDYNCPHCSDFALETFPLVEDEFIASGQVKYVVYPYALWDESLPIVEAAACAHDQDSFWDFHHLAFSNQERFSTQQPPSRDMLREWAETSGLDVDEFQACLDQGRNRDKVTEATQDAQGRMGIRRTPTLLINGFRESASLDVIRAAVEAAGSGE
jgi:protein-disulfide isomerase